MPRIMVGPLPFMVYVWSFLWRWVYLCLSGERAGADGVRGVMRSFWLRRVVNLDKYRARVHELFLIFSLSGLGCFWFGLFYCGLFKDT